MKRLLTLILTGLLVQCQTETMNLNGHYASLSKFDDNSYITLDIVDSLVLINNNIVFKSQRDTIIIDPKRGLFAKSNKTFPFFDFKVSKDTVILYYSYDAGTDKVKFIKSFPSNSDYFSSSEIDIGLQEYENEQQVNPSGMQIRNITVGTLKRGIRWAKADSVYIEFENEMFINLDDISNIGYALDNLSIQNWAICLNLDNKVPDSISNQLKLRLKKSYRNEQLLQTRIKGDELVFVKIAAD